MCGISGIADLNNSGRANKHNICVLSNALRHRGPDGEGYLLLSGNSLLSCFGDDTPENVRESALPYSPANSIRETGKFTLGLSHRRLSVIDVTPNGHQPMCDENQLFWAIFNGEIYNYIEIREKLKEKGYHFTSLTDTEVVIASYMEWGLNCTDHFNGMWSFVLFDKEKNQLFGSRDRTGVKPFYYHIDSSSFSFASELKALTQLPYIEKRVNKTAALEFLMFNAVENREASIFDTIQELFPSHSFILDLNTSNFNKWKYFEPDINCDTESFNATKFNDCIESARNKIIQAIHLRLRSDVPVGTCLSGGIDSSSIAGVIGSLMNTASFPQVGSSLNAFTCSFTDKIYDESDFAKTVVDKTNCNWIQTYPKHSELLEDIEDLIHSQDVPLLSTSTYAQYRVMKLAKENGIKVLLDGQGGDELFAGYHPHYYARTINLIKTFNPKIVQQALKEIPGSSPVSFMLRNHLLYRILPGLNVKLRTNLMLKYYDELKYLNPDLIHSNQDVFTTHQDIHCSSLNKMLEHEYFNGPMKRLLKCEDRNSMRFSVESRTPFADDIELMQYIFSIPEVYKIVNGRSKALLRESMKPFLPEQVYNRTDKKGYVTPNNQWISDIKDSIYPYFENCDEGIFNKKLIIRDFNTFFNPTSTTENYRIFKFMSFVIWQKTFDIYS